MNIKKYLNSLLYILIGLLLTSLIITILNYYNLIDTNTLKYFKLIAIILPLFISGIYIGKQANKNGYIEGLKVGGIVVVIIALLNYLGFNNNFSISSILYYMIILISSVLGSIIGINKKLSS